MPQRNIHVEIDFEGRTWPLDFPNLRVSEAIVIKTHTGFGVKSWLDAVGDFDPAACQALFWLCKVRNGEPCNIATLDFDLFAFMAAFEAAFDAAGGMGALGVDPTGTAEAEEPPPTVEPTAT